MKEYIILLCYLGYVQKQKIPLKNDFRAVFCFLFVFISNNVNPELVNSAAQSHW